MKLPCVRLIWAYYFCTGCKRRVKRLTKGQKYYRSFCARTGKSIRMTRVK